MLRHPITDRIRRLCACLAATALLAGPGFAGRASASPATPSLDGAVERARLVDQMQATGRRGFLFDVVRSDAASRAATHLYLYGTLHAGRVGSEPFNAPVVRALRASRRIALEADPTNLAAVAALAMRLGRYAAGDGLDAHLPPALMARVRRDGAEHGIAADEVVRLKPWLVANMITARNVNASGLDADLGSELYLAGFEHAAGIPLVEIEGLEAQLHMLADSPDALQVAELEEALDETGGVQARAESEALFALWATGDVAAGDALVAEMHRDAGRPFERYVVETLIDARNRTMADQAVHDLDEPGDTFFAVGALHLFGDTGLLRVLARRGYRVTDLQPPLP